ncbi:hypothetical protein [Erwinia amylovora]
MAGRSSATRCCESVSYTHLDVYKRQARYLASCLLYTSPVYCKRHLMG